MSNFMSSLIALYLIVGVVSKIFSSDVLFTLTSLLGFVLIVISLLIYKIRDLIVPIALLLISAILIYLNDVPLREIMPSTNHLLDIIILILVSPILLIIIRYKPYLATFQQLIFHKVRTGSKKYFIIGYFSQGVSAIFSVVGISLSYNMFKDLGLANLNKVILQAYCLTALWTVFHPSFLIVQNQLDTNILKSILIGFSFSFITLWICILINFKYEKNKNLLDVPLNESVGKRVVNNKGLLWELLVVLTAFLILLIVLSRQNYSFLISLAFAIISLLVIYFLFNRDLNYLKKESRLYIFATLFKQKILILNLLCCGIFIYTIKIVNLDREISELFFSIPLIPPEVLVILLVILFGLIGIGPVPTSIILIALLDSKNLEVSNHLLAFSLLLGVSISTVLSPFSSAIQILSSNNSQSPFKNSLQNHLKFAVMVFIFGQIYILILKIINIF